MRPQQQNRRMRGRNNNNSNNNNNNNRRGPNPLTRSYESNGPDVKIRGSAQQIAEKYTTLARDAMSSGDRVMAENYLQHAEHYNRIIAAAQAQMPQQIQPQRSDLDDDIDDEGEEFGQHQNGNAPQQYGNAAVQANQPPMQADDGSGPQPVIEGTPAEVALNSESVVAESEGTADEQPLVNGNGHSPVNGAEAEAEAAAPKRSRRPRRPRTRRGDEGAEGEAAAAAPSPDAPSLESADN